MSRLLNLTEVCAILGVERQTFEKKIRSKLRIRRSHVGGHPKVLASDLAAYIERMQLIP